MESYQQLHAPSISIIELERCFHRLFEYFQWLPIDLFPSNEESIRRPSVTSDDTISPSFTNPMTSSFLSFLLSIEQFIQFIMYSFYELSGNNVTDEMVQHKTQEEEKATPPPTTTHHYYQQLKAKWQYTQDTWDEVVREFRQGTEAQKKCIQYMSPFNSFV